MASGEQRPASGIPGGENTVDLITRVREGSSEAANQLCERYVPTLRRWARGRLPGFARDLRDTEDLVQETMFHTVRRLDQFEPRHRGALQAYLRQALMNRVRDEVRRAGRRSASAELTSEPFDHAASPLEQAIGRESLARYAAALERLKPEDREAIVCRVELGFSYAEVASALNKPTPDAARMAVGRALVRLAAEMRQPA